MLTHYACYQLKLATDKFSPSMEAYPANVKVNQKRNSKITEKRTTRETSSSSGFRTEVTSSPPGTCACAVVYTSCHKQQPEAAPCKTATQFENQKQDLCTVIQFVAFLRTNVKKKKDLILQTNVCQHQPMEFNINWLEDGKPHSINVDYVIRNTFLKHKRSGILQ